jgi:hypothetical protein
MKTTFFWGAALLLFVFSSCGKDKDTDILDSSSKATFEQFYGTANEDNGVDLLQLDDGGFLVVGNSYNSSGQNRVFVLRTKADGTEDWRRTFGVASDDLAAAVIEDGAGGFYVSGKRGDFPLVLHLDQDGRLIWEQVISRTGIALDLQLLSGRLMVLCTNVGAGKSFISELAPNLGQVLQVRETPVSVRHTLFRMVATPSGQLMACGTGFEDGQNQLMLFRFSADGVFIGYNAYAEWQAAAGMNLIVTSKGEIAACGITARNNGEEGILLSFFNEAGVRLRGYAENLGEGAFINSLCEAADGGFMLAGRLPAAGKQDQVLLAKFTSNGGFDWHHTEFGGPADDSAHSIIRTRDGGYAFCGQTESYGLGEGDVYLVKTNAAGRLR